MNNDVSIRRSINGIDYDFRLSMSEMVAIYNEVSHRNMVSDIRQRLYERQEKADIPLRNSAQTSL